jgi:hypothetical protein
MKTLSIEVFPTLVDSIAEHRDAAQSRRHENHRFTTIRYDHLIQFIEFFSDNFLIKKLYCSELIERVINIFSSFQEMAGTELWIMNTSN